MCPAPLRASEGVMILRGWAGEQRAWAPRNVPASSDRWAPSLVFPSSTRLAVAVVEAWARLAARCTAGVVTGRTRNRKRMAPRRMPF